METRGCSFPGCMKRLKARGMCDGHLGQQYRGEHLRPLHAPGSAQVVAGVRCTGPGCTRAAMRLGLCGNHQRHLVEYGELRPLGPRAYTDSERYWAKVDKNGPIVREELGPCWKWLGNPWTFGYGQSRVGGKNMTAHRASWILHNGPIPPGLVVCHKCDNPPCTNPEHLFLGTRKDNSDDCTAKGRWSRGSRKYNSRVTEMDVANIRSLSATGTARKDLAASFGVCKATIDHIISRRNWRHVP